MSRIRPTPRGRLYAGALLVAMLGAGRVASAETCAPEPQGEGRIAAIIDARTLRLDDGRVIRLAGLAGLDETRSAPPLLSRHIGATVSLHSDSDAPDRYGRQHAVVFVEGAATSLQIALVAAGAAVHDGIFDATDCRAEFAAAEASARRSRSGVWSAASPAVMQAQNPDDIQARIGQFVIVEGQVRSVRQAGSIHYLNFGQRWTQGFSVTISNRSAALFEAAGLAPRTLEGRKIRVRGMVEARTGPRIDVSRPMQIELAGEASLAAAGGKHD